MSEPMTLQPPVFSLQGESVVPLSLSRPGSNSSSHPGTISVVIPAYNAAQSLENTLVALCASRQDLYEIIVVDDASSDATSTLAARFPVRLHRLEQRRGAGAARNIGVLLARGETLAFVDADIVCPAGIFKKVRNILAERPEVDALVGRLEGSAPVSGYFSRYKNLYMEYVFSRQREEVDFLFTSFACVRRRAFQPFREDLPAGEDTELGRRLHARGGKILLLPDFRVAHFKEYTPLSFFRNDFQVPFAWSGILLEGLNRSAVFRRCGFAHARLRQLLTLALAFLTSAAFLNGLLPASSGVVSAFLTLAGLLLFFLGNSDLFSHMRRSAGLPFALLAGPVSFADALVMGCGIVCGLAVHGARILLRLIFPDA